MSINLHQCGLKIKRELFNLPTSSSTIMIFLHLEQLGLLVLHLKYLGVHLGLQKTQFLFYFRAVIPRIVGRVELHVQPEMISIVDVYNSQGRMNVRGIIDYFEQRYQWQIATEYLRQRYSTLSSTKGKILSST